MQDNPFNLLLAFFSGSVLATIIILCCIKCCSSSREDDDHKRRSRSTTGSQRNNSGLDIYKYEPTRPQSSSREPLIEVLFFPDKYLPCKYYRNGLMQGTNRCGCRRAEHLDRVHFGDAKTSLVKLWDCLISAKRIDLCMFRFTLTETARLLVDLKEKRGVRVRIISDVGRKEEDKNKSDQISFLREKGIEVREKEKSSDEDRHLMHHKFVILDDRLVFNGSFNWTMNAVMHNEESLIKIGVPSVVNGFRKEFDRIWKELAPSKSHTVVNIPK